MCISKWEYVISVICFFPNIKGKIPLDNNDVYVVLKFTALKKLSFQPDKYILLGTKDQDYQSALYLLIKNYFLNLNYRNIII